MKSMFKHLSRFRKDEKGTTLVEYGIALLVAIIVGGGGLITLANTTNTNFTSANTAATRP
ncbi:Flp family type IVb pilin [Solirhodobacter olei]|uniref:Flp family type IVb pilin n=1 Tax=Solirhodobacter olei TaxID=2493082 RepID=UPI0019D44DA5|nr:Flp family type IVb pilin [Solirhodobacter olei]